MMDNMSRHEMLEWVNGTVHGQYKKIEELCSGVAYCQMLELIFPNCIGLRKVKMNAKLEHEHIQNLKLFQSAFTRLKIEKIVDIDRIVKGRFQDNLAFLQWFKKFFDSHAMCKENVKVPAAIAAAAANAPKPIRKPPGKQPAVPLSISSEHYEQTQIDQNINDEYSTIDELMESKKNLEGQMVSVESERNYYFQKLTDVEMIIKEALDNGIHVEWCKIALKQLYSSNNDADAEGAEDDNVEDRTAEL